MPAVIQPLELVSMVGVARTAVRIRLAELAEELDLRYEPEMMAFAMLDTKATGKVMIYASGTLIYAGQTSLRRLEEAHTRVVELLSQAGYEIPPEKQPVVCNLVAKGQLDRKYDLGTLTSAVPELEYEPEVFPAAILRFRGRTKLTVLLFSTGKFMVTGAKSLDDLKRGEAELIALLDRA